MEHIVHLIKEMLASLGANLHPSPALRCSQAVKSIEDLLCSIDSELNVKRPSTGKKVRLQPGKSMEYSPFNIPCLGY